MVVNIKKYCMVFTVFLLFIALLFKININAEIKTKNRQNYSRVNYNCHGIVVDRNGKIYIGNNERYEVDVYSNSGKYLYSFPFDVCGGFHIEIDDNNNIIIGATREETLLTYSINGELISSIKDADAYERIGDKNDKEFKDKDGNTYRIEHQSLFGRTRITKTTNGGIKTTIMSMSYDDYVNKVVKVIFIIFIFVIAIIIIIYSIKHKLR